MVIVDTRHLNDASQRLLGSAAVASGDRLLGWHVSDDIAAVTRMIRRGGSLGKSFGRSHAELGAGLYVSAAPGVWVGRSRGKWRFIADLGLESVSNIAEALRDVVVRRSGVGYVTRSEECHAMRLLELAEGSGDLSVAIGLAGQPYNIAWWSREFLSRLGVSASPPLAYRVAFEGRYASIAPHDVESIREARRLRCDGVFTRSSVASNPELCIWNAGAVVDIGPGEEVVGCQSR